MNLHFKFVPCANIHTSTYLVLVGIIVEGGCDPFESSWNFHWIFLKLFSRAKHRIASCWWLLLLVISLACASCRQTYPKLLETECGSSSFYFYKNSKGKLTWTRTGSFTIKESFSQTHLHRPFAHNIIYQVFSLKLLLLHHDFGWPVGLMICWW